MSRRDIGRALEALAYGKTGAPGDEGGGRPEGPRLDRSRPMILWRRLRGWWHRLWHHPLDDYRRLRADLPAYRRQSGIPSCGPGFCRRKPLRGRVHCHVHAAAHARRLQARRRRKARRTHLQRIRRR